MLLQIVATLGCFALAAGGGTSHTSVFKPYGGSYTYGIDHNTYGAWYGTPLPPSGDHAVGGVYSDYGHGAENGGGYGYSIYGAGYGHGDYGTSYQNHNVKTIGGEKVVHSEYGIHHGHGATSYANLYQKTGHSNLYAHHGSYAGGYGHEHYGQYGPAVSTVNFNTHSAHAPVAHYGPAISSQNFNLYSAGHGYAGGYSHYDHYDHHDPGHAYSVANFNLKSHADPVFTYSLHDLPSLHHADHSHGFGYDGLTTLTIGGLGGYNHALDYAHLPPYYGGLHDHGLYDYAGYGHPYYLGY